MRAVLGASQAQAELRVFSCGWISMANPEVFQDSPFFFKIPVTRKGITLHFMAAGAEQETAWICQDNQEKNPAYFWAALQKEGKN